MKRMLVVLVALAAVAAAAVPSPASAAKIKHRGNLIGAPATPVSLTVIKNGGKVTKIRGFKLHNVILNCDGATDPVQFEFLKAFGAIRVANGKRFGARLQQRDGAGSMRLRGTVRKRGKRTRGTVKATLTGTDFGTCRLAKRGFRTKKV
ncbi:MAG TPA: hypothetical protein VK919_15100 [Solirubrobacterales bacterium]|nr:hypothetical protein [Solirubrobacterales bacterium]